MTDAERDFIERNRAFFDKLVPRDPDATLKPFAPLDAACESAGTE